MRRGNRLEVDLKRRGWVVAVGVMVGLKLAAHTWSQVVTPYGIHRDELLYVAMGDHLRLWHMDFPPFIALAANLQRLLFGNVLWGLRVLPALAGAALIWVTMDITRRLGGRVGAQIVAGGVVLLSPLVLRVSVLFQPVVFDQLWWSLALWALLRRGLDDNPRWWIGVGAALGMGLLTKFSIAFLALPLAVATILTPLRKDLTTRWPWAGTALAVVIGHPSLAGQVALGWPFFTQMADLRAAQLSQVTAGGFLLEQVPMIGPAVVLAVVGVIWLVAVGDKPAQRTVGLAALGAFMMLLVLHGKPYYAGPVFPLLLGAGAAALSTARPWLRRTTLGGAAVAQLAFGALALPLGLPVLAPEPMAELSSRLGITEKTNVGEAIELPQDYADMLGWEEFADTVIRVWRELDPADRDRATLLATNYGRAGALDWFGRSQGLPPAVAPVGSYWFWGYGEGDWSVVVVAGGEIEDWQTAFRSVVEVARIRDSWRVPEERDVGVFVARDPFEPASAVWPRFRGRN